MGLNEDEDFIRNISVADTNTTGQGRYAPSRKLWPFSEQNKNCLLKNCWSCEKPNCLKEKFPLPLNHKNRMKRIKYFEAKRVTDLTTIFKKHYSIFREEFFENDDVNSSRDLELSNDEYNSYDAAAEFQPIITLNRQNQAS